jgi:hypothetical protein
MIVDPSFPSPYRRPRQLSTPQIAKPCQTPAPQLRPRRSGHPTPQLRPGRSVHHIADLFPSPYLKYKNKFSSRINLTSRSFKTPRITPKAEIKKSLTRRKKAYQLPRHHPTSATKRQQARCAKLLRAELAVRLSSPSILIPVFVFEASGLCKGERKEKLTESRQENMVGMWQSRAERHGQCCGGGEMYCAFFPSLSLPHVFPGTFTEMG